MLEIVGPNEIVAVGKHEVIRKVVPPLGYRSALMKLITPNGHKVLWRLVSVNAFYFHLLIPLHNLTEDEINQIKEEALAALNGSVYINDKGIARIKVCDRVWVNTVYHGIASYRDQYKTFFETERKKKNK